MICKTFSCKHVLDNFTCKEKNLKFSYFYKIFARIRVKKRKYSNFSLIMFSMIQNMIFSTTLNKMKTNRQLKAAQTLVIKDEEITNQ